MNYGLTYNSFHAAQQKLLTIVLTCTKREAKGASACALAAIDIERIKREMRGLPPLATHKLRELLDLRTPKRVAITDAEATVELDTRESLSTPPVPAPPTTEPQAGGGVVNNKPPHLPHPFPKKSQKAGLVDSAMASPSITAGAGMGLKGLEGAQSSSDESTFVLEDPGS